MTLQLDPARTALLCMDFQRDIIADSPLAPSTADARERFESTITRARKALDASRETSVRVVHVRIAFSEGYPEANLHAPMGRFMRHEGALIDGTAGADFDPRVAPAPGEALVTKRGVSAFVGTELDRLLRVWGVDTLALTGLVTHYVVEGTARHASDLGYHFVVLEDACTSGSLERHAMSLTNLRLLGTIADVDAFAGAIA